MYGGRYHAMVVLDLGEIGIPHGLRLHDWPPKECDAASLLVSPGTTAWIVVS
jgi:hypothetical protein